MNQFFKKKFSIIGNFPYNISSQILFKVYENKNKVNGLIGMFQKEVAERIIANVGTLKDMQHSIDIISVFPNLNLL